MKVLTGLQYTQSRIAGILHEAFVERTGQLHQVPNVTIYGEGSIRNNTITNEIGLVVDVDSEYFGLGEPHLSRLVDIVDGDGWMDTVQEVEN